VGGSQSFRASVQPLVRDAARRGASVNELTASLRATYGHAYRRADMLVDLRAYRSASGASRVDQLVVATEMPNASAVNEMLNTAVAIGHAVPSYLDFRRTIARAGVAVFAISLLMPTVLFSATRATHDVLVADANESRALNAARLDVALPNQVAGAPRRLATPEPTPAPTPEPTPVPTPAPPVSQVAERGGPGVLITASWYGPGFYENRLPCWQWLQANGLPIQFLPDTWGVAHKTLPCGTMLILTHGANTITVPVVDRGPYIAGREIDMSPRIKAALGCTDLCTVLMQIR
jgi:hypothetical protein